MTDLRVLYIDDEPDIRDVVELSLGLDHELVTRSCASGQEGLAVAADWGPNIIVLDVMMPGMDGPATLARLRDDPQTAKIPVVFMTARAQTRELDMLRSLGAAGIVPKPFDPMSLAATIRGYMRPLDAPLEELRKVFLRRVRNDAAMLARYRAALDDGEVAPTLLANIRAISHGLAGAGGIFGFSAISRVAAEVEETIVADLGSSTAAARTASALDQLLACINISGALRVDRPRRRPAARRYERASA